jgi:hypothetical protein
MNEKSITNIKFVKDQLDKHKLESSVFEKTLNMISEDLKRLTYIKDENVMF